MTYCHIFTGPVANHSGFLPLLFICGFSRLLAGVASHSSSTGPFITSCVSVTPIEIECKIVIVTFIQTSADVILWGHVTSDGGGDGIANKFFFKSRREISKVFGLLHFKPFNINS